MSVTGTAAIDGAQAPLYVQLAHLFRRRISSGVWKLGERLPSLERLVNEFDVARVTVRQAVGQLTRDGLVSPQQGRGTFVTGKPVEDRWLTMRTTVRNFDELYRNTVPTILNIDESMRSPPSLADDGTPAERYVYMRRVHQRDGKPYCVINIYLDKKVFDRQPAKFRGQAVLPLLLAMRTPRIAVARQVLTVSTADLEVARHLGIGFNAPVAEVRRVFTDPAGKVIYLGEITYRGDCVRMEMDLQYDVGGASAGVHPRRAGGGRRSLRADARGSTDPKSRRRP
ncbi:MAG: GntR family transcriptional regulator [Burkholderiales bacterium]|nr:GntR family transcriptional regulator [Burkholderiales bacterium]